MKATIIKTLSVVVLIATLFSCNQAEKKSVSNSEADSLTAVEIGYSQLRISTPIFVAQDLGIFKKHHLNAKLTMFSTAQPLMQAMIEGKVDVGGYTALPIAYTAMGKSGKQLLFISGMVEDSNHRISYLLKRKPSPGKKSSILSIHDLKGKKIGILPTIAYKGWLEEILRKNGVNPNKDVVIQQIAPEQQALALKSGGVDALFTGDPVATATLTKGISELISNDVECPKYIKDPFLFGSFNVTKSWAGKNPDALKKITAALNEAIDSVNANPAKAKMILKNYLPENFKAQAAKYPDALYLRSDKTDEVTFSEIEKIYLKLGIIPKDLKLTGLVVK